MSNETGAYRRIAWGTVITLVGQTLTIGLAFATRIGASKLLAPSGYGLLILSVTVLHLTERIAALGFPEGIARNIPRSESPDAEFTASLLLSVSAAGTLAVVTVAVATPLATVLSEPAFAPLLRAIALGILASAPLRVLMGGFRGVEDPVGRAAVGVLKMTLISGGVLGVLLLGFGLDTAVVAWMVAVVVTTVLSLGLLVLRHDLIQQPVEWGRSVREHGRRLLVFSLPLMGTAAVWVLLQQIDNLLIGFFLSSRAVGIYDASYTLSRVLILFLLPAQFLFLPVLSSLFADSDDETIRRVYYLTTKTVLLVALPTYVLLLLFAPQILSFVFTPAFSEGSLILMTLATGFVMNILLGPTREALVAAGSTRTILNGALLGLGLNLALNVTLIPVYGTVGAAVATAVAFGTIHTGYCGVLYRNHGISPVTTRVGAIAAASGTTIVATRTLVFGGVSPDIAFILGFSLLAYLVHGILVLVAGAVDSEDVVLIEDAISKTPITLPRTLAVLRRFSS